MNGQVGGLDWTAGLILAVSFFILLPGILMFWFRDGVNGGPPRSPAHYTLERGLVAAWVILTVIGFVLLQGAFQSGLGQTLANIGGTAYAIGSILLAASELLNPTLGYGKVYRLAAGYVVIAFLAQALIGVALLLTGMVAPWVAWVSIIWNLGWLVAIPLVSPRDIYFPVLHSLAPLMVGIALLVR